MNELFGPVRKTRVAENLASEIRQNILKGTLIPGDKLPSERELAKQCSTSRITAREAFRLLESEGLLAIKQGIDGGAFITETDHKMVEHSLRVFYKYGFLSIEKLTETRIIIEPEIAKLAAVRRTKANLKEMEKVIIHCQDLLDTKKADFNFHLQFHYFLAKASKNPLLMAISNSLVRFLGDKLATSNSGTQYTSHVKDQKFHQEIFSAIKKKNADQAQSRMLKHIQVFSKLVKDIDK
jgi:GntR family transcriptional repressor for pyruvate dehydrogenase complex